jgi:hypothetical protein
MMNLRIPLSVFVVASVIGLMAVTAIAAMSMQKAYSQPERWCFDINGRANCYHHATTAESKASCNENREAALKDHPSASECYRLQYGPNGEEIKTR